MNQKSTGSIPRVGAYWRQPMEVSHIGFSPSLQKSIKMSLGEDLKRHIYIYKVCYNFMIELPRLLSSC